MTRRPAAVTQLADAKLSASTSFSEREVAYLDQLLAVLRRGGTVPQALLTSGEVASLSRKLPPMRAQIARNRETRERIKAHAKVSR